MPTLEWIGKDKVINHHLDVPYRVLERKYSYDEAGQACADGRQRKKGRQLGLRHKDRQRQAGLRQSPRQ